MCSCAADIGIPVCGAAGPWIPRLLGAVSSGTASHLPFPHHPSRKDQPHREKPRHFRRSRSPPGSSGNRDRSEPRRQWSHCRYEDPVPVVSGGQEYLVVIPILVHIPVNILRIFTISRVYRRLWPFTDDSGSRDQDCNSSRLAYFLISTLLYLRARFEIYFSFFPATVHSFLQKQMP